MDDTLSMEDAIFAFPKGKRTANTGAPRAEDVRLIWRGSQVPCITASTTSAIQRTSSGEFAALYWGIELPPKKELEFSTFLQSIGESLGRPLATRALEVWSWLRLRSPGLPLPAAEEIPEEHALQFTWRRPESVLSIEIRNDGMGWYARNRKTGESDGGDVPDLQFPPQVLSSLARLAP